MPSGPTTNPGALREAEEEFAAIPSHTVVEVIVDRPEEGGWSYSTVIADVAEQAILEPINPGNTGRTRWVTAEEMSDLPLHPGLSPTRLDPAASG